MAECRCAELIVDACRSLEVNAGSMAMAGDWQIAERNAVRRCPVHGSENPGPEVERGDTHGPSDLRVAAKFDPHPPRLAVDADGYVWRDYGDHWSMCPVSNGNEPVREPITYYEPTGPAVYRPRGCWAERGETNERG